MGTFYNGKVNFKVGVAVQIKLTTVRKGFFQPLPSNLGLTFTPYFCTSCISHESNRCRKICGISCTLSVLAAIVVSQGTAKILPITAKDINYLKYYFILVHLLLPYSFLGQSEKAIDLDNSAGTLVHSFKNRYPSCDWCPHFGTSSL